MAATTVATLSGTEGDITVSLKAMPALACPQGHKRFTSANFPATLMEALVSQTEMQMKACAESGLLFKKSVCIACREPLPGQGEVSRAQLRLNLDGGATLEAEVSAPAASCGKCGTTQLTSAHALDRGIPAALVRAFESAALQTG